MLISLISLGLHGGKRVVVLISLRRTVELTSRGARARKPCYRTQLGGSSSVDASQLDATAKGPSVVALLADGRYEWKYVHDVWA